MDNVNTFVSTNGLAANVQITKRFIEQDEREVSRLQSRKERLIQDRADQELRLGLKKKEERDELLRQIDEVNNREKIELARLSESCDRTMAPLEEKMKRLKANIDTAKAAIAPIRTLPAEILGNVFREFIELNQPPWILAMVSKSWRQTTLTTPWLWRYLYVGNLVTSLGVPIPRRSWIVDGGRRCYTTGNKLVCYGVEDLQIWAESSGVVPLDVKLYISLGGQDVKLLQLLLAEPLSSRIESLFITFPTGRGVEGLNIGRFPLLRRVSIESRHLNFPAPLVESILTRSLVEEFRSQVLLQDFLPGHRFWNSIRVLSLNGFATPSQLNKIIEALTVVENILGLPETWPDKMTPRATLTRVRAISAICQPEYLARLRFPQLETLQLSDPNLQQSLAAVTNLSDQSDLQMDLHWQLPIPKLVDLAFFGADATWLSRLSAPALQTMAWKNTFYNHPAQTAFPHVQFPNVENFSFDADCNDEILQSALDCFPNVQVLSVGPGIPKGCGDKWALALLGRLLSGEVLPKLRRLTLGNEENRAGTNKLLAKPLIKGLIQSRNQTGTPIEHLEVVWTKRNSRLETIQYVK